MRSSYNAVMPLALLILLATSSQAEAKTNAVVSGVVTDIEGAVVPGTEITFINERTKKKVMVTTSEIGRYEVRLPQGVYSLSTEKHAFCSFRRAGVRFKSRERQAIDVEMRARPCGPHLEPLPAEPQMAPIPSQLETAKPDH
jgi:carboxypeptidase family protein